MQTVDRQIQMFFSNPIHGFKSRKIRNDIRRLEKIDQRQREILINGNWNYYKTPEQQIEDWLNKPGNLKLAVQVFLFASVSVFSIGYNFENIRFVMIIGFLLMVRHFLKKKPSVS